MLPTTKIEHTTLHNPCGKIMFKNMKISSFFLVSIAYLRHTHKLCPPHTHTHTQDTSQDIGLGIQECLGLMSTAYRGVQGQNALIVEALLLENIYSVSSCNQRCLLHRSHHPSPLPPPPLCPSPLPPPPSNPLLFPPLPLSPPLKACLPSEAGSCPVCLNCVPLQSRSLPFCVCYRSWRQVWLMRLLIYYTLLASSPGPSPPRRLLGGEGPGDEAIHTA